ncbi:MAG: kelch repeat-containing protein [Byssovorax sp.]
MPSLRPGLAPILPVALLGLVFAACSGDTPDLAAPAEELVAAQSSLSDVGAIGPTAPVATPNVFSGPATAMVTLRSRHTASLLANGNVLAAGGTDGTAPLADAELFNPATSVWTATASMAQAREQHAAVVLANGKVLVTGGLDAGGAIAGVELYDPQTTLWTARAPMANARARHTMTKLANGTVLVVGGTDGAVSLASCEIYAPATDTWTPIAPLHQARARHTTALLADGRVLVVGGSDDVGASIATTEILSVSKGTWSFGAPLATARQRHTATLLVGGELLVVGGAGPAGLLASAERYFPGPNLWISAGPMTSARADHTAVITPQGMVLVSGGQGASGVLAAAEAYDPVTPPGTHFPIAARNPWFSAGSMGSARAEHTVTVLANGTTLHVGGAMLPSSELFVDSLRPLVAACSQAAQCASGACSDGICCDTACAAECMGCDATGTCVNRNGTCDGGFVNFSAGPAGNCISGGCQLSFAGFNKCTAGNSGLCGSNVATALGIGCVGQSVANGSLPPAQFPAGQPCGGMFGPPGPCNCVSGDLVIVNVVNPLGHECATPADCGAEVCVSGLCAPSCAGSPCWSATGGVPTSRVEHTATLLPSGKILFAGGRDAWTVVNNHLITGVLENGDVFDPVANTWTAAPMAATHYGHTATLLPGGQVLVLGGGTMGSQLKSYVQIPGTLNQMYAVATSTWAATGPLLVGREYHTSTLLAGGQILVAGGIGKDVHFNDTPLSAVELYTAATGASILAAPMPIAREHHTATLLATGRVLMIGGTSSTEVDVYDPTTDTWSLAPPLPAPRSRHTATTLSNGLILVTGGVLGQPSTSAQLYNPLTDTWTAAASMAGARAGHAATMVANGDVVVTGGGASAERYTPLTDTWAPLGSMLVPSRQGATATLLPDGRLLVGFGVLTGTGIWGSVNLELATTLPLGQPCASSATCGGATCVDGVCCNTACAAGACDACTIALGAVTDGICTILTGTVCDDGDGCTTGDTCLAGVCGGSPLVCATPDLCHLPASCDPQTGQCAPSAPKICGLLDACNSQTCDLPTGSCNGPAAPLPNGTSCPNGTCQAGACTQLGSTSVSASTSAGVGGSSTSSTSSTSVTTGAGGGAATSASSGSTVTGAGGASSSVTGGAGGDSSATTGAVTSAAATSSGGAGCACTVETDRDASSTGAWLGLGLLLLASRRRSRAGKQPTINIA